METRGRNKGLTLNGLFWRYLLTTAAWSAALCLAALYLVQLLVLLGVILPAGAGEWSLDQTAAALQAQETFAPEEIPFFYQYALVEDGTLLETNMTEQEQDWARQVLAGDTARHGFPYTKYYRTVPLADGRRCLLQYDYAVRYTDPVLREALPDFQLTTLLLLAALLLLVALRRTRRYARLLRRDAQAITAACQGVARQDLEAPFPQTAQVQELQAALAALDTLRQELSRSLQEQWAGEQQKDALLAALAHDLKTPLTIIGGNAELLAEDPLPAAQDACVQAILRGTQTATDYVARLQAVAAGGMVPPPDQSLPLPALAAELETLCRDLSAAQGVPVSWQTEPSSLPERPIAGARDALIRAAENLLSNGIRYNPPDQPLACGLRLEEDTVSFWVQDSGPGFSQEALHKAGKTFYTEEASRPQGGHLGLGLYSAAQTARAYGGGLRLENTAGGGRATLWFPVAR